MRWRWRNPRHQQSGRASGGWLGSRVRTKRGGGARGVGRMAHETRLSMVSSRDWPLSDLRYFSRLGAKPADTDGILYTGYPASLAAHRKGSSTMVGSGLRLSVDAARRRSVGQSGWWAAEESNASLDDVDAVNVRSGGEANVRKASAGYVVVRGGNVCVV